MDAMRNADAEAGAVATLRVAYLGSDIDAVKDVAVWCEGWAASRGAVEVRGAGAAPAPLVELMVYAGMDNVDEAEVVAIACEGAWSKTRFAGLAHVAPERHNALLAADLVVDATAVAARESASGADPRARDTLEMDMLFLAPDAPLAVLEPGEPVTETLDRAVGDTCR